MHPVLAARKSRRVIGSATLHEAAAAPEQSRLDRNLQRLANLSQPAVLALGIFGYFYTVVPVFQNQQLQEQAAKLEIEKGKAERQLESLLVEQKKVIEETRMLQSEWEKERARSAKFEVEKIAAERQLSSLVVQRAEIRDEIARIKAERNKERFLNLKLSEDVAVARAQESTLRHQSVELEASLREGSAALTKFRWELLFIDVTMAMLGPRLTAIDRRYNSYDDESGQFIEDAAAGWPKPSDEILAAIDLTEQRKVGQGDIPKEFYDEYKDFVRSRGEVLRCDVPDLVALRGEYKKEVAALDGAIDSEMSDYFEKLRRQYSDKRQILVIGERDRAEYRRVARIGKVFALSARYKKRLLSLQEECEGKGRQVIEELRRFKGATR